MLKPRNKKRSVFVAAIVALFVCVVSVRVPGTDYSLFQLEMLGRVPDDANERTWRLCEKTSWWGRRLDSTSFWSNRVVWLSQEAESEAHAHGRGYPPIPPSNTLFLIEAIQMNPTPWLPGNPGVVPTTPPSVKMPIGTGFRKRCRARQRQSTERLIRQVTNGCR